MSITCEDVQACLMEGDLAQCEVDAEVWVGDSAGPIDEAALGAHLDTCDRCSALLVSLEEGSAELSRLLGNLAATVAPDADPTAARTRVASGRRRVALRWRVLIPLAAATLAGVAFFGPRGRDSVRFQGGPEWALPVANLRSIQPVVVSSARHKNVAVLPTDNPNITIVWFMD